MKFWSGSLLLALLIIFYLQFCVEGQNSNLPVTCCFNFYQRTIPAGRIKKYEVTRSDCPKAAVIFSTKRNIPVCVDANLMWVQRTMQDIDLRTLTINTNHPHHGTEPQNQPTAGTLNPEPAADLHRNETDTQDRQEPNTTSAGSSESETESQEPKTFRPEPTKDLHGSETEAQEPKTFSPDSSKDLHGSETKAQEPKTFQPEPIKDLHGSETEAQKPKTFRPELSKDLHGSETEAQKPKTFRPESSKDLHESETKDQ